MKSCRAFVDPVSLSLIAAAGIATGIFVGNWKPLAFLRPKPPTAELHQAQADLEAAKVGYAKLLADLKAENAKERSGLEAQVHGAQQMSSGASLAIAKVPVAQQTPAVKLAASLIDRTNYRLSAAVGNMTAEDQEEILTIVGNALSDSEERVAKADAALAAKDADFNVVTADRDQAKAKVAVLTPEVEQAHSALAAKETKVNDLTAKVADAADKLDAKDREAGSLGGSLATVWFWVKIAGLGYLIVHFALPSLAQEFPAIRILTAANKATKSIFSAHL